MIKQDHDVPPFLPGARVRLTPMVASAPPLRKGEEYEVSGVSLGGEVMLKGIDPKLKFSHHLFEEIA